MSYTGFGCLSSFLFELALTAAKRFFVVTGGKSFENSSANKLLSTVLYQKELSFFNSFKPNFSIQDVVRGRQAFLQSRAEVVLAIGGGSVMDMAKLACLNLEHENEYTQILEKKVTFLPRKARLYCIPTTAGSGSEATHFAVVYKGNEKYSVADQTLCADDVVLDPELTLSMSPYLTACSGFDALSQAVESSWARGKTTESIAYAQEAVKLILPNIVAAVNSGEKQARQAMLEGSYFAGRAINISKTTAPHALSYYLTKHHGVPHGNAVALLMAPFFVVNGAFIENDIVKIFDEQSPEGLQKIWYELMQQCGLSSRLSEYGVKENEISHIVKSVNVERLGNNPVNLNSEKMQSLLKQIV